MKGETQKAKKRESGTHACGEGRRRHNNNSHTTKLRERKEASAISLGSCNIRIAFNTHVDLLAPRAYAFTVFAICGT